MHIVTVTLIESSPASMTLGAFGFRTKFSRRTVIRLIQPYRGLPLLEPRSGRAKDPPHPTFEEGAAIASPSQRRHAGDAWLIFRLGDAKRLDAGASTVSPPGVAAATEGFDGTRARVNGRSKIERQANRSGRTIGKKEAYRSRTTWALDSGWPRGHVGDWIACQWFWL